LQQYYPSLLGGKGLLQKTVWIYHEDWRKLGVNGDKCMCVPCRLQIAGHVEQEAGLEFLAPINHNDLEGSAGQFLDGGEDLTAI
jgi:hypothetical protein